MCIDVKLAAAEWRAASRLATKTRANFTPSLAPKAVEVVSPWRHLADVKRLDAAASLALLRLHEIIKEAAAARHWTKRRAADALNIQPN